MIHLVHVATSLVELDGAGKIGQPNTGASRGYEDRLLRIRPIKAAPTFVISFMPPGPGDPATEKKPAVLSIERNQTGSPGTEVGCFFACRVVHQMNTWHRAETAQGICRDPTVASTFGKEDENVNLGRTLAARQNTREFQCAGLRARALRMNGHDQSGAAT